MLPMLLHRALPPPAGPPVTTNRHRVRFTRSGIQGYRQPLQSQSNPFGLTYFVSGRYLRIGRCKPIAAIPLVLQEFTVENGPFFRKSESSKCGSRPNCKVGGVRALSRRASQACLAPFRKRSMPSNEAGRCRGIIRLPGKPKGLCGVPEESEKTSHVTRYTSAQ